MNYGTLPSSEVVELSLDLITGETSEVWRYKSDASSFALGDVQRLSNGNTLVTYSSAGEIHEIAPSKALVRILTVDGLGYSDWRPTLYGEAYRY